MHCYNDISMSVQSRIQDIPWCTSHALALKWSPSNGNVIINDYTYSGYVSRTLYLRIFFCNFWTFLIFILYLYISRYETVCQSSQILQYQKIASYSTVSDNILYLYFITHSAVMGLGSALMIYVERHAVRSNTRYYAFPYHVGRVLGERVIITFGM